MSKTIAVILIALALGGCVAVWGRAYEIEAADADAVTIKYDGHFTSSENIQTVAQASCAPYGRSAVPQGETTSFWGLTTANFTCGARP
jgi:hypothetical protein